jgi:hypothetical protein
VPDAVGHYSHIRTSGTTLTKGLVMISNRRVFMMTVATAGAGAALLTTAALAQAKLDEKDPQAIALGYVADATKADKKKYPKHTAEQICSNCALYQGKAADAAAPCTLFAGKQVPGKAWCGAWVKKA